MANRKDNSLMPVVTLPPGKHGYIRYGSEINSYSA